MSAHPTPTVLIHGDRARNGHALLLTTGQFARISVRESGHAHPVEFVICDSYGFFPAFSLGVDQADGHIVQNRSVQKQIVILEHKTDFRADRSDILWLGAGEDTGPSPKSMVPALAVSRKSIVLSKVDFPDPLGPIIETTLRSGMSRSTPSSTNCDSNDFRTPRIRIIFASPVHPIVTVRPMHLL